MLRDGEPKSWRLLTASGVLQRCLPELDDALARPTVTRSISIRSPRCGSRVSRPCTNCSETVKIRVPRSVLLGALVLDACGDSAAGPLSSPRRTVQRLDLGARIEQAVAGLVGDAELLTAAARRADALSEESVLQIAVHLGTTEQADALYLLSRAAPDAAARIASGCGRCTNS